MSNNFKLGLVIGGVVSATVGKAFKDVESKIKSLDDKGAKARILQRTIGETIKLRDEWKRAHDTGAAGASILLSKLNSNLSALKAQGVEVGRLSRAYQTMGRTAQTAELQSKGRQQIEQGRAGLKSTVGRTVVASAALVVPAKVSAEYGAIIRDIAIKAGIAGSSQETQMSKTIIETSRNTGMARNDVAEVVNALVGAGMDLKEAISYAPVAAKFVVGQGADGADTAKMINALGQNAKINDPKVMQQALEAIAYQGQAGSFEASDMARWFPQMLASMGKLGITGMDAVTQLGALLQVQMKTAGGADEAANNLKNWIEKIGSAETVKAYERAGIDYQKSLQTGLHKGMSTLESSFELAQRYIEKVDPDKARQMADATAKINKETDPVKAQAMINALEQALRTGDLFADMQVKAALTAFMQNKLLYQTLKKDSREASGILDKNLGERRSASAQKWKETGQAMDDAMRSVGDAIRPITDQVASGLTAIANGLTALSDKSPGLVSGLVGVGAAVATITAAAHGFKLVKGLINVGRGALAAESGPGDSASDQRGPKSKVGLAATVLAGGLKSYIAKDADTESAEPSGFVGAALEVLETLKEFEPEDAADEVQKVFVTNVSEFDGGSSGRRARNQRGRNRRRRGPRPPPPPPRPPPIPRRGLGAVLSLGPKLLSVGKAIPGEAALSAGLKALDTYQNAQTADEKASGYGEAAGGLAGSLAGAAAGAAIGSVVPVIGTAVGALIGGLLGAYGGDVAGGYLGKKLFGGDDSLKRMPTSGPLMMKDPVRSAPPVWSNIAQSFEPPAIPLMLAPSPVLPNVPVHQTATVSSPPAVVPLRPLTPIKTVITGNEPATSSGLVPGDVAKSLTPKPAELSAAPLMLKVDPPGRASPTKVEQKVEISAPLHITVKGDVKDPQALVRELMPYIQQQQRDISGQLERSRLYDEPHL